MSIIGNLIGLVLYAGFLLFTVGVAMRIVRYARTSAPLKIPIMPAPITVPGVAARLFREVVLFESLFKASIWTWLFGWVFHAAMLVVVLGHLRYFTEPVWPLVEHIQSVSRYAGLAMVLGVLGLQARRVLVDRVRYISAPSDHLMLALFLAIAMTGILMRYVAHPDIVAVKMFALGLIRLDWQPLPHDLLLGLHLLLVGILMMIFPFSKLLHAPGVFFSPTLNQVDNARERHHQARWPVDPESTRH